MSTLYEDIRQAYTEDLVSRLGTVALPSGFKKSATIKRLTTTIGSNGNVVDEAYATVVDTHNVCIWPITPQERYANEQLGIKASHNVHPISYVSGWQHGDFYYINSKLYRIMAGEDHGGLACHFKVWEGTFGNPQTATSIKRQYTVENVPPGVYTFGAGLFASVPVFASTPFIHIQETTDCALYIPVKSTTGFTLNTRGIGTQPEYCTVYIRGI